jgi:hypothetical protein
MGMGHAAWAPGFGQCLYPGSRYGYSTGTVQYPVRVPGYSSATRYSLLYCTRGRLDFCN